MMYKAKQFMLTIFFQEKLIVVEDRVSHMQAYIINTYLSRICLKHDKKKKIDVFLQIFAMMLLCL